MSRMLRDLLDADEPQFSLALQQLERESGSEGRDAQLIGTIATKVNHTLTKLGLDPHNTTGREVYAALLSHVATDDRRLRRRLGVRDDDDAVTSVLRIVRGLRPILGSHHCWVLKHSFAKRLLKASPPKRLMAYLGYQSVDDLVRHESFDEISVVMRFSEGPEWLGRYNQLLATVIPDDFETRAVSCVVVDPYKYAFLTQTQRTGHDPFVLHSKEMGIVGCMPTRQPHVAGMVLAMILFTLHSYNEVCFSTTFFKLWQATPNFGATIVAMTSNANMSLFQIAGQQIDWRIVQRYYNRYQTPSSRAMLQSHIDPEDLSIATTDAMLIQCDAGLAFWEGLAYVGKRYDDGVVSYNMYDVVVNYIHSTPLEHASTTYLRDGVWEELLLRYMGSTQLEKRVVQRLADVMNSGGVVKAS